MSGFSESAMAKRLQTLNTTVQSVQTLSMWLLHHQKAHAEAIVDVWLNELLKESRPKQLINMLYLANDVIQNSRRQCPNFMNIFYKVLGPAFRHVSAHADQESVIAMKKILKVFRERQIYPEVKIDKLVSDITATLIGIRLVEFNLEIVGKDALKSDSAFRLRLAPSTPPGSAKSTTDSPLNVSTPSIDSPEAKKSRLDSEGFDVSEMTRITDDLLIVLKKLEDPPSADADTRQLIAAFPETIANPELLKPIRNELQAKELLEKINEAEPVVKSYCKRLATEMEDRRSMQQLLFDYFDYLKSSAIRNDDMLRSVREKVEKLDDEKSAVKEHFDSLPDLSELPAGALTPLPSLGELFKIAKSGNSAVKSSH